MEFIASGSNENPSVVGYYFRMRYPKDYKSNMTKIIKFDRDYNTEIEYNFFGLFPLSLSSIPVQYSGSDVLKVNATFNYERYVCGRTLSLDFIQKSDNNKLSNSDTGESNTQRVVYRPGSTLGESGVRGVILTPGNVNPRIVT